MKNRPLRHLACLTPGLRSQLALLALTLATAAQAEQVLGGITFSGSGFLSLVAGKVLRGNSPQDFNGYSSPMFVSDYAQGGIYQNNGWTLKPDSKLGVQGTATFNSKLSATGQIVSHGARDGRIDLEWAYASYAINDQLTFQVGRKRLPLFYYSETQDVGFIHPWTHLPSGQYGWEIVNYNGVNLLYRDQWADWSSSVNVFAGDERRNNNPYQKIYNGRSTRTDSRWSNIIGADLSLTRNWFEGRMALVQSDIQNRFMDPLATPPYDFSPKAKQKIYSLSFYLDPGDWVVNNEYLYIDRKPVGEEDFSTLLGIGYRFDKLLPMLTFNCYRQRMNPAVANPALVNPADIDPLAHEGFSILAISLRYDLSPTSAVKIQLDDWRDQHGRNFNGGTPYGNPQLLTVSYDLIF